MKNFLLSSLLIFLGLTLFSQYQNVRISNGGNISEPSISMNPKNTNELVAGTNLNVFHYSIDGGLNWTQQTMVSNYRVAGDPCLITDTAGFFYYLHLSSPIDGSWLDRIVCQKFDLESEEWIADTYMGLNGSKDQDKEWAIVDRETNTIYVSWTQFDKYDSGDPNHKSNIIFSKSTDGGLTWSAGLRINEVSGDCLDDDNTTEGAVPAVGPNGEVLIAWSGPAGIVFDRSLDGGENWLDEDISIDPHPGGWAFEIPGITRCNGMPITCCDLSPSQYNGTIYVNWSDQRNGEDDTDIWLSKSIDGGNTWSSPQRVNNDEAGKQQFFTWMTIDQANGDIYIVFYDRRNYDDNNTDVYLARSNNGGETFENILISESPFIPQTGSFNDPFFGDYTNIAAHNGLIRPIWARQDVQQMSIWTALIDMSVDVSELEATIPFSLEQNYPNPFRITTYFSFKLHEDAVVSLVVYDVYGRQITRLIDNKLLEFGNYIEPFEAAKYHLPPGVYYFTLTQKDQIQKRKMLLIE